jgi:site-specific recombinase XerD
MRLADAIEQYIAHKRAAGCSFARAESRFAAFYRRVGDLELDKVTALHVQQYLDSAIVTTATWRNKYFLLLRFFEYWVVREATHELVMPPVRRRVRQSYIPYVYTRAELRALLRATILCQQGRGTEMSSQTFRALMLFLYGTGARSGEALALRWGDLNLTAGTVVFPANAFKPGRTIPLNSDLRQILQSYSRWRIRARIAGDYLFATRGGKALSSATIRHSFNRLCKAANIRRCDGAPHKVRLLDLRCTFAVHRITSWIRNGADLSRMLPALAVYMGQVGLGYTENYLLMTPERFRKQLNRLSPAHSKRHWRDDGALMDFLAKL